MAFEQKTWYNDGVLPNDAPEGTVAPCLDADNLNRIESGIAENTVSIKYNADKVDYLSSIVPLPSYLTFVGNANANMVAAAFGKGNEDEVTGIGKALTMYSHYKEEGITFSALQNYDNLKSISLSQDAIDEVLSSPSIVALMRANAYTKPYIELWRLNDALPKEYRGKSFGAIVQNTEAMSYMYDNYATFEALEILSHSVFLDEAARYGTDTNTITYKAGTYDTSAKDYYGTTVVYDKKCLIIGVDMHKSWGGSSNSEVTVRYRPNGTSRIFAFVQNGDYDDYTDTRHVTDLWSSSSDAMPVVGKGQFASRIEIYCRSGSATHPTGTCRAIIIPCE